MGQEINSTPVRLPKFMGLNLIRSDTSIGQMEASALQNVNILNDALMQRGGSLSISTNLFKDKTDTTAKAITGLYSGVINGTRRQVGVGGDAFKVLTTQWTDATGAVTVTDDPDNLCSFATFFDNGGNECFIICPEQDAPFKWTGGAAAAALAATPGNFKFPVVHMNRLWVAVDDIIYVSDYFDCETWDVVWDLQRFRGDGEKITGVTKYSDRIIVFKPSSIHMISGSSYADYASAQIVTGDGCASGYSIQEIEDRRYGNILAFLSKEGQLKGFNGSKNLIPLGDPAKPLYDKMNKSRLSKCGSAVYKPLKQYWLTMSYGSDTAHSQIMAYDYYNDTFTGDDGQPLSTCLYHVGIDANCLAIFETAAAQQVLVTADYDGNILRQDYGLNDEGTKTVEAKWQSGKLDMGDPSSVKLLTDLSVVTTQSSETHLSVTVTTQYNSATGVAVIPTGGSLWGTMVWGTSLWSEPDTKYTRVELTPASGEDAVSGRYFLLQLAHSTPSEAMRVEDVIMGASNLGQQPQYVE